MDRKSDFRIKAKSIRKGLDIAKISLELCQKIKLCDAYMEAKNVLIFYPLKYEVNLLQLLDDRKKFYLPRINNGNLDICQYKIGDTLQISSFKTLEPNTEAMPINILDLIIVPALAADKNNFRLGYGKGYYDRLLAKTSITTILPIAKELVFEKIPIEPHDKPVDILIQS